MEAGLASFGDAEGAKKLLDEIEKETVLGRLLGNGAAITGKVLGIERVAVAKGQMMPGYDPRGVKGHGITFATSPMGADHTAGMTIREGLTPSAVEGQSEASKRMQLMSVVYDSLGMCLFIHVAVRDNLEFLTAMVNARYGVEFSVQNLMQIARETLRREISFNRAAGLSAATDRLPEVFSQEVLPTSGTVFDITKDELDAITVW